MLTGHFSTMMASGRISSAQYHHREYFYPLASVRNAIFISGSRSITCSLGNRNTCFMCDGLAPTGVTRWRAMPKVESFRRRSSLV